MDPVVKSSDWHAWENLQPPSPFSFHVEGIVTVVASNYTACLEKAVPQGINPKELILNLIVSSTGQVGATVLTHIEVSYQEDDYIKDTYTSVLIVQVGGENGNARIDKVEKVY